jgi:hypothetical protein
MHSEIFTRQTGTPQYFESSVSDAFNASETFVRAPLLIE